MITNPIPFISNDLFILFSDVLFIEVYSEATIHTIIHHGMLKKQNDYIILFINTSYIFHYLPLLQNLIIPFVLITTCNDDICVPYVHSPCENQMDDMSSILDNPFLVKWFTKNPCITHNKIIPIPLGPKWQYNSWDFFGEDKQPILDVLTNFCLSPLDNFLNKELKRDLLYFNFGQTTSKPFILEHTDMREKVESIFLEKGFSKNTGGSFEEYIKELRTYKFCLSPPGRGVDTHRTWEALMVGTIPIMVSTCLDSLFVDLPVIIVDDWNIITPEFLENQYINLHSRTYDFSILYSDYWKNILCSQKI